MRSDPLRVRRKGLGAAVGTLLVACLAFAACGGSVGVSSGSGGGPDLSKLEAKLVDLQNEKSPDLTVGGAQCPTDVDLQQGAKFECTVTIEGVDAPYSITLTEDDPEGAVGSFHIEPAKAIINVAIVTDFIATQAGGADAECGTEKIIVSDVGGTFDCTVNVGGHTENVQMIVRDIDGTVAVNN
jgi:hypothetical protein